MYRYLLVLSLVLGACSTPVKYFQHLEQDNLHKVLSTCEYLAQQHRQDSGAVNCQVWELSRIHLTFPDHKTYQEMSQTVAKIIKTWCYNAQAVSGQGQIYYSWSYRKEQATFSRLCPASTDSRYGQLGASR